jgi:hypothetical protein
MTAIVPLPLPFQIADGQVNDAAPVMGNLNYIANQVNTNGVQPPPVTNTNTFFGYNTGNASTSLALQNTGFGYNAMPVTTGQVNVAVGYEALLVNTSGSGNVAIGASACSSQTTATFNIGIGGNALALNVTGFQNIAVGVNALARTTASQNVAVGAAALLANTGGAFNVAVGDNAAAANTTASGNIAIGASSLGATTTGGVNVAIGGNALATNITGTQNVAIGGNAMNSTGTAITNCVSIGFNSMLTATGNDNVGVGVATLESLTSGTNNTAVGFQALSANISFSNCSGLGSASAVTASNQVQLGDSSTTTYAYGAVQNRSDVRDKTDVRDTQLGLAFINALRPVDFRWNYRGGSGPGVRFHHGLIAQEVAALRNDFGGLQDHSIKGGHDVLSIGYTELIAPLIKAIQELTAIVAALEDKAA